MDKVDRVTDRLHRSSQANWAAECPSAWTVSLASMDPDEVKLVLCGP